MRRGQREAREAGRAHRRTRVACRRADRLRPGAGSQIRVDRRGRRRPGRVGEGEGRRAQAADHGRRRFREEGYPWRRRDAQDGGGRADGRGRQGGRRGLRHDAREGRARARGGRGLYAPGRAERAGVGVGDDRSEEHGRDERRVVRHILLRRGCGDEGRARHVTSHVARGFQRGNRVHVAVRRRGSGGQDDARRFAPRGGGCVEGHHAERGWRVGGVRGGGCGGEGCGGDEGYGRGGGAEFVRARGGDEDGAGSGGDGGGGLDPRRGHRHRLMIGIVLHDIA
mmetsp:Transcript_4287/g.19462  ORF Transcript_4287/g.19462 Transcript_4287/m.19462 type:complete len:282 (-) Transcript_4287:14-859(-)